MAKGFQVNKPDKDQIRPVTTLILTQIGFFPLLGWTRGDVSDTVPYSYSHLIRVGHGYGALNEVLVLY